MDLYQKMYLHLFNEITDALKQLSENQPLRAVEQLKKAQQTTENMYISRGEENIK